MILSLTLTLNNRSDKTIESLITPVVRSLYLSTTQTYDIGQAGLQRLNATPNNSTFVTIALTTSASEFVLDNSVNRLSVCLTIKQCNISKCKKDIMP